MESRLVEYFADEFNNQLGSGFDVRKSPKAMSKLKKQVKRTKEILSANTAAPISVESLYDDRDFRYVEFKGNTSLFITFDRNVHALLLESSLFLKFYSCVFDDKYVPLETSTEFEMQ